jgi:CTP:molybdopterin cytidylyltransferase MocA
MKSYRQKFIQRTFELRSVQVLEHAMLALHNTPIDPDKPLLLTIGEMPKVRTSAENRLLHSLISEIADNLEWSGKKHHPEVWKRLLVAAWCRVHGESVEILPALDGHGVDIVPARTSKLSKTECADLIEYVTAFAITNGIKLRCDV